MKNVRGPAESKWSFEIILCGNATGDNFLGLSQKLLHKPRSRDVDPRSLFADSDPAVLLNADPDPSAFVMRIRIRIQLNFY